jgi:SAM-dependent methyltransferase
MDRHRDANRRLWDEWAEINARSELYRLPQFKAGEIKLHPLERAELGEVRGKTLLHLMCHFGMDTLSWARLGAVVTGVDFSPEAIRMARDLSAEVGVPGRFLCTDLYELPRHLDEQFDVVYTSYGVLSWLPDLAGWAQLVARYLRPGGTFYIAEIHPTALLFSESVNAPEWRVQYDYFETGVLSLPDEGCYSDRSARSSEPVHYEWTYRLGDLLSVLIEVGLRIEFVREHPFTVYQALPFFERREDGYWHAPEGMPRVPMLFSLRAIKPEAGTTTSPGAQDSANAGR